MTIDDILHPAPAPTKAQVANALEIIKALADAIRALGTVPSGHLYARVMGRLSLADYEAAIGALKRAGLVEERQHELRWVGPPPEIL